MDERDVQAARRKVADRASGRQPDGLSGERRSEQVRSGRPTYVPPLDDVEHGGTAILTGRKASGGPAPDLRDGSRCTGNGQGRTPRFPQE